MGSGRDKPSIGRGAWAKGLLALAALAGLWLRTPAAVAGPLDREVAAAHSNAKLGQATVSVAVMDVDSGELLAGINERSALAPASNLKLITSGVALIVLGKDYQFTTRFLVKGDRLIILGGGDPGLADPMLLDRMGISLEQFFDQIISTFRAERVAGIREVVVDDRIFDRDLIHPSWPKDQLSRWYCAPVSGLSFMTNCIDIYATRGQRAGSPPNWRTVPAAPWIEIINKARTIDEGQATIGAIRMGESTRFTLSGTIRSNLDKPISVAMHDPGAIFGRLIADRLAGAGMSAGATPTVRTAGERDDWTGARQVGAVATPLTTAIARCNVESQNLYAECLLKAVGHKVTGQPGSWSSGASVARMTLNDRLGADAGALVMSDGSGLSRDNRVTASLMTNWLAYLARQPEWPDFFHSMASGDEGRLASRFKNERLKNEVRAKTGFIDGVSCLSGYVINPTTGRRIAFSVLVNDTNKGGGTARAREFHDEVVARIDRWLTAQAARSTSVPNPR